ncbi:hypothetical protein [Paenibacillus alkalitolerans]|uniref:hypothetical protein n=1 Tax=Paenibacillus alkalitolerans TaxID=2799335 RepID=UPI0018F28342|nr:hypothetical protein [Paenibacillus alkalitolerans]
MKLRLLPIIITVVVSSAVLFGGWFMYQTVAMEDPLTHAVDSIDGVGDARIEVVRSGAIVRVTLEQGADLRETYRRIKEAGSAVIGERKLTVEVVNEGSESLDRIWAQVMFDVAQAMETKQYTLIPERLNKLVKENNNLKTTTEMDDDNVYITLSDGSSTKYVILPRIPLTMGVWPNE